MSHEQYSMPVSLKNVKVHDGSWKERLELIRTEVLPCRWEMLNDRVEGAPFIEPKYTFRSFETLPEEADNGKDLHLDCLIPVNRVKVACMELNGHSVKTLLADGKRIKEKGEKTALYREYRTVEYGNRMLTLIPHYAWANRGGGEMQIWMRSYNPASVRSQ